MNKKILIGSLLVFIMLLLMPTIPAIQQQTLKDGVQDKLHSDLIEQLDFKEVKEIVDFPNMKYPRLYDLVIWWLIDVRFEQVTRYWSASIYLFEHNLVCLWLLCLARAMFIHAMLDIHVNLWVTLSNTLGWDWNWDIT